MKNAGNIISLISKVRDKANGLITSELKKHGITDIAPSHGAIFNMLFKTKSDVNMQDIANKINKDKSTVTALINKLVKLGYVKRTKSTVDSRVTFITLTQTGKDLEPIFYDISKKLIDQTFANFDEDEKKYLAEKLEKIINNF